MAQTDPKDLDQLCVNTIRTLSMDAVQEANSGHPGTPMGMAPVAYCLWQRFLRFDPDDPIWPNRDRFVLSTGHASMLLYSLLHLTGVKAVDPEYEIARRARRSRSTTSRRFRQLDSRCPGHPEYRWTSGVETTTGPLGQGVATSVGMAIAGRWLAQHFNRPGFALFDYDVYALCGDGCMMEGISSEAASLAGHLKLSNLCWIYDNNHITIEGNTALAFSDDVAARFLGLRLERHARRRRQRPRHARARLRAPSSDTDDRPTLIIVDSHIGYGAPHKQDTSAAHGEPLGEEEIRADQAALRLAGGREVPRARRRARALRGAASASAAHELREAWMAQLDGVPRRSSRSWPTSSSACSTASCPTAGTRTCRPSRPTRRASPAATRRARC